VVDLVRALERLVDALHDARNAVRRDRDSGPGTCGRRVRVRSDLPTGGVDRIKPAFTIWTAWLPVSAPSACT
jgi:hypothetical protein